jgi:iron(III) transport system substrate-binding protein
MTIMRANPRFTLAAMVALLVASCNAAAAQSWQAEWQKTLAAAKQEGKVTVAGPPGSEYRKALTAFSKSHPDIQLDYVGIQGRDFAPRIMQERRAGQFLWDVHIGGPNTMFNVLLPAKALDPLRPALILPEVSADKSWRNGFDDGWMDDEAKHAYGFIGYLQYVAYVNRDAIAEKEFSKTEDLWHPKWKGKIVWHDPRREGTGTNQGAVVLVNFGEEALTRLFRDQAIVLTEDYRQLAEWVVRGRYPIGIGINLPNLQTFQNEGLGKNVKPFKDPKFASTIPGFGTVSLVNRGPHPNAARVYLNWLLSKEAQSLYAQTSGQSSRRLDAQAVDPEVTPEAGVRYLNAQKQRYQEMRKKVNEIAKEVFK